MDQGESVDLGMRLNSRVRFGVAADRTGGDRAEAGLDRSSETGPIGPGRASDQPAGKRFPDI